MIGGFCISYVKDGMGGGGTSLPVSEITWIHYVMMARSSMTGLNIKLEMPGKFCHHLLKVPSKCKTETSIKALSTWNSRVSTAKILILITGHFQSLVKMITELLVRTRKPWLTACATSRSLSFTARHIVITTNATTLEQRWAAGGVHGNKRSTREYDYDWYPRNLSAAAWIRGHTAPIYAWQHGHKCGQPAAHTTISLDVPQDFTC